MHGLVAGREAYGRASVGRADIVFNTLTLRNQDIFFVFWFCVCRERDSALGRMILAQGGWRGFDLTRAADRNNNGYYFSLMEGTMTSDMGFRLSKQRKVILEELRKVKTHPTADEVYDICLLYTSPSPRDRQKSRMPSSA
eukprot:TRINITY_DN8630_c0_g1_i1.p1 TRINITY_DN8630_c0_g1~~TRINITY_DN8630_c0_g1_i1.p1  ORF type:complete len:140 (+),score=17.61 TRINITY_DN8630_c0_g1_i1:288-707(+)